MNTEDTVSFCAVLYQAKTEPSGGWRVTFDIPESDSEAILILSKMRDAVLQIGVVKIESDF